MLDYKLVIRHDLTGMPAFEIGDSTDRIRHP